MSVHKLTATFEAQSRRPEDAMVNTWYFEGGGSNPTNAFDLVHDFYEVKPDDAVASIAGCWSAQVITGSVTFRLYDLSDPEPRVPVASDERTVTIQGSAIALPAEVALCMSYHAQIVSGTPAARRRGRVYLGGFVASVNVTGRPSLDLVNIVVCSARDLIQASNASSSWEWQQYSQTTGTGNIATGGWCDNAWDTQRRRGVEPSVREVFTGGTP